MSDSPLTDMNVASQLEEDIVLGLIYPRERLIEDELMHRFNVKRHIIRQSFVELERMGLVERKRNVGAIVRSYSVQEVINLFQLRELLETFCVETFVFPVGHDRIAELERIQAGHDEAIAAGDQRQAFRSNMAFHRALFRISENPILVSAIQEYAQRAHGIRSSTLRSPHYTEIARKQHWDMIDAIKNGDRKKLIALCREHLIPSRDSYIELNSVS